MNFWSGLRAQFKPCDSCKLLRRGSLLFLFHCQSNASDKTREAVLNICCMFEEDVTEVFTLTGALQPIEYIAVAKKGPGSRTAACMVGL